MPAEDVFESAGASLSSGMGRLLVVLATCFFLAHFAGPAFRLFEEPVVDREDDWGIDDFREKEGLETIEEGLETIKSIADTTPALLQSVTSAREALVESFAVVKNSVLFSKTNMVAQKPALWTEMFTSSSHPEQLAEACWQADRRAHAQDLLSRHDNTRADIASSLDNPIFEVLDSTYKQARHTFSAASPAFQGEEPAFP
jgi:hypothetical protein